MDLKLFLFFHVVLVRMNFVPSVKHPSTPRYNINTVLVLAAIV